MRRSFLSGMQHAASLRGQSGRGVGAAVIAGFAVACALLIINGPHIRAAEEAERARVMAKEDGAFCSG